MTGKEIAISKFKDTVLETIANKANIVADDKLTGVELNIFETAVKGLGYSMEELGLQVSANTDEKNTKSAFKADKKEAKEIDKTYERYLGNAKAVKEAENEAAVVVETARRAYQKAHGEVYVPAEMAERPMFTEAKYLKKPELYIKDLAKWAERMANAYANDGQRTNEELAKTAIEEIRNGNQAVIDATEESLEQFGDRVEETMNETAQKFEKAADEVKKSNAQVAGAINVVNKKVDKLSNKVDSATASVHAHLYDNDFNNMLRTKGIHDHIDDQTGQINKNTVRVGEEVKEQVVKSAEATRKEQKKYAKIIIDILKTQPDKESIARDILKGLAKDGVKLTLPFFLGLPFGILVNLYNALSS